MKYLLKKTSELIISQNPILMPNSNIKNNIEDEIITSSSPSESINPISVVDNLSFISGVIKLKDELKMKRMIFRVSRGRAIASFYNLVINNDEYLYTSSIKNRGLSHRITDFNKASERKNKISTKKKYISFFFFHS